MRIKNGQKFIAWYNGDNPIIIFESIYKEDDEIYFYNEEHDIRYPFETPFIDCDFIVELVE